MKTTNSKDLWIEIGYFTFALEGLSAIKIESLSKKIGISKSSFYHHFADLEIFISELLAYHINRAILISNKAEKCVNFKIDFLELLVESKIDIFFNKQLRIQQQNSVFKNCFEKADEIVLNKVSQLWATEISENKQSAVSKSLLKMITDIFYQRINIENYNHQTLQGLVDEFIGIIFKLRN